MLAVSAHQLADEHPVKAWSMVMFMVQSNLRRYIRDSKDIGKAQLNKRKYHEVMLPNELSYFKELFSSRMYVQLSSVSELWRRAAKAGVGSLEWLSSRPASSLFFLAGLPPLSTIQVRFSEIHIILTNFTIIAVFVLLAQSSFVKA